MISAILVLIPILFFIGTIAVSVYVSNIVCKHLGLTKLKESDDVISTMNTDETFYDKKVVQKSEHCEYCKNDGKEIVDEDDFYVYIDEDELFISTSEIDDFELIVQINYCPMCGRKF